MSPARRNPRTGVEDRWRKTDRETGKRVPSAADGKGKRWRARWVENDGRERAKSFTRKVDAQAHLDAVTTQVTRGEYVPPEGPETLVGTVLDRWLAGLSVKRKTRVGYESAVSVHVRPAWGRVPLKQVTVSGLRAWLAGLQQGDPEAKPDPRQPIGAGYARKVGRVFSMALETAVDDRLIASNPFGKITLPRQGKGREGMSLTRDQLHELVAVMPSERDRVLTLVLGYCGLRWGEAIALTPRAVDWRRRRLNVARTYAGTGGARYVESPKNHERRWVPFPPFMTVELETLAAGKGVDEDLFSNDAGRPLDGTNWLPRLLRPSLARAGVPDADRRTIHDLRHTYASLAVQAGANVKMLQQALGHADPGFTLRVYADLFEDDYADLGGRLEPTADALRTIRDLGDATEP